MPGLWPAYLNLVRVCCPRTRLSPELQLLLQLAPLRLFYPEVIQAEVRVPRGPREL